MMLDPKAVGAAIRARRTDAALTQAELAERLNVSAQSVSAWVRCSTRGWRCLAKAGIITHFAASFS